jgi:serine/threonine-protein kinase
LIALEQGRLIAGRYRLLRPLGAGASAQVWAARDQALGREVALKVLSGSTAQGGRERERLQREARLLALLDHPRITIVYDYVEAQEPDLTRHPILVTELLTGTGLDARLKQGPLPARAALAVCAEVAEALAAAHRAGIVHRDVKPGNVMLTAQGAKLLDFGISRRAVDADLTGAVVIGTPACMAPEQWRGESAQPASDVYALGCLLFWCLSGHASYADRELPALGLAHLLEDPPELPSAGLGDAVTELYRACTRKSPDERPSADEAARVLASGAAADPTALNDRPPTPVAGAAATSRAGRTGRTGPARLTVSAAAAAAVLGTAIALSLALTGADGSGASVAGTGPEPKPNASHGVSRTSGDVPGAVGVNVAAAAGAPRPTGPASATRAGAPRSAPSPGGAPKVAPSDPGRPSDPPGSATAVAGAPGRTPSAAPSQTAGPATSDSPSGDPSDTPTQPVATSASTPATSP